MPIDPIPSFTVAKLLANFDFFDTLVINISSPTEINQYTSPPGGRDRLFLRVHNVGPDSLLVRPSNDNWGNAWVIDAGSTETIAISSANELWFNTSGAEITVRIVWGW